MNKRVSILAFVGMLAAFTLLTVIILLTRGCAPKSPNPAPKPTPTPQKHVRPPLQPSPGESPGHEPVTSPRAESSGMTGIPGKRRTFAQAEAEDNQWHFGGESIAVGVKDDGEVINYSVPAGFKAIRTSLIIQDCRDYPSRFAPCRVGAFMVDRCLRNVVDGKVVPPQLDVTCAEERNIAEYRRQNPQ